VPSASQESAARWPLSSADGRAREREEREREKELGSIQISSHFSIETQKTSNTKVVENLKIYNFCFIQKFV
jgi:hypothetical protein